MIDNFTARPLLFRPVTPPFFNYTKNIIRYALESQDSISIESNNSDDSFYFKFTIHKDKQVEFFGKAHYIDNPYSPDPTSIYELWINKSNNLPYKVRREMSHNISVTTCSDVVINKLSINDFNIYDYFPSDYEIRKYGEKRDSTSKKDLTGTLAPDWNLKDTNEQTVAFKEFKSKVLLINFTGIGCGPCKAAIPFLNELKERFSKEEVELIAIENWGRTAHSIQNYTHKNGLKYQLLAGADDIAKKYQTGSGVPVFYILDNKRVIRKIIYGYSPETTDKEITDAIKELL